MKIRRLEPKDRPHMRPLFESTNVFGSAEIECALEMVDDIVEQADDYEAFVAAGDGDEPIGIAIYGPTPMTDSTWDLYWIAAHQRVRGTGVGKALMARVEQEVRERKGRMVRIETSGKDAYGPTRGFYEKTQYRVVGHFPNFYRAGEDLVILAKDLDPAELRAAPKRTLPS